MASKTLALSNYMLAVHYLSSPKHTHENSAVISTFRCGKHVTTGAALDKSFPGTPFYDRINLDTQQYR